MEQELPSMETGEGTVDSVDGAVGPAEAEDRRKDGRHDHRWIHEYELKQISGEVQTPHEFSDDSVVTWQELSEELGFEALLSGGNGEGMGGKHRKHRYEGSPTTWGRELAKLVCN